MNPTTRRPGGLLDHALEAVTHDLSELHALQNNRMTAAGFPLLVRLWRRRAASAAEPVEAGERLLCPWQQRPSFGCEADVALLAVDERDAQLTFELADRCRERGLGA